MNTTPRANDEEEQSATNWAGLLRQAFGLGFWGFTLFTCVLGAVVFLTRGDVALWRILDDAEALVISTLPRVIAGLGVAGLVRVMLPTEKITRLIGAESGLRGLLIGMAAGCITPGGPSTACALILALGVAGADRGALMAFFAGWATLNLQRLLIWELPFMGEDFVLFRFALCLPLPILAGLLARRLPFAIDFPAAGGRP